MINTTTLLGIADRAAAQYGIYSAPFADINQQGSGFYWEMVTATNDPEIESYLMPAYYTVDQDFDLDLSFKAGLVPIQLIVTSMDAYFNSNGVNDGWDGYLRNNDIRVSYWFNNVYYAAKSMNLLANNVFSEEENIFGTWEFGDIFIDGSDYGNGSWNNYADGTFYAATQVKAVIDAGSTPCSSLVLTLSCKDINNNPVTIDTPAITGAAGTEVNIGITTDRFLDTTNIVVSSGAIAGNKVNIVNLKERQVSL